MVGVWAQCPRMTVHAECEKHSSLLPKMAHSTADKEIPRGNPGRPLRSGSPACLGRLMCWLNWPSITASPAGRKLLLTLGPACSTASPVWEVFLFPAYRQDPEAQGAPPQSHQLMREGLGQEPTMYYAPKQALSNPHFSPALKCLQNNLKRRTKATVYLGLTEWQASLVLMLPQS